MSLSINKIEHIIWVVKHETKTHKKFESWKAPSVVIYIGIDSNNECARSQESDRRNMYIVQTVFIAHCSVLTDHISDPIL